MVGGRGLYETELSVNPGVLTPSSLGRGRTCDRYEGTPPA